MDEIFYKVKDARKWCEQQTSNRVIKGSTPACQPADSATVFAAAATNHSDKQPRRTKY